MHIGKYVFAQITQFLPQRYFRRILTKNDDRTKGWSFSHWNHILVLMGCGTLRELTDITTAHGKKSKHLGFGYKPVNRQMLSKANLLRNHRIFEEFAFHMVSSNTTSRLAGLSSKSCASLASLHSPQTPSLTCSNLSSRRRKIRRTDNSVLSSNLIDISRDANIFFSTYVVLAVYHWKYFLYAGLFGKFINSFIITPSLSFGKTI